MGCGNSKPSPNPVVTQGGTSINLQSNKNNANSGSNSGPASTGDNPAGSSKRPDQSKTDKVRGDFERQGSRNVAPTDQTKSPVRVARGVPSANLPSVGNGADSRSNSGPAPTGDNPAGSSKRPDQSKTDMGTGDSERQGSRNVAPIDQNSANTPSPRAKAPADVTQGSTSTNLQSVENRTDSGPNSGLALTRDNPASPLLSQLAPGGVTQGGTSVHIQSIKNGADSGSNSGPAPAGDKPRHLDKNTKDKDRGDSAHQGSRNGASVDQNPTSSQSEPPTRRGKPTTPGTPVDSNPANPTSSQPEVQAQPPTRRGNPTTLGAPVDNNPTHLTSSQPEAPGAQAPNTFRSETPIRRGNSSTPDAPVNQNPTHSTSSQPEALGNQAQNTFRSGPPTHRGNPTTPGAPVDQNPTHPTSSQPEAPVSVTQENTSSNLQTPSINNGADSGSNFGPDPTGDIPPGSRRYPDPNEKDKARGNFTRQGPTHGTLINQNSANSPSPRSEACVGIGQGVTSANSQSTRNGPDSGSNSRPAPTPAILPDQSNRSKDRGDSAHQGSRNGAPVDQNRANPTSSQSEAPVSVTQENTSSNLQTLNFNNGAESGSNSYPGPKKKKKKGRGDSTPPEPTHDAPIDQNSANPRRSRSEAPVGVTQGGSSANLQSAKNGLDSGSNSRLAPALARYLDRIEKANSGGPTLPYPKAPVGVTEWGTVIYADLGLNSARYLGGDDQPQTDKSQGSSTGQVLLDGTPISPPGPSEQLDPVGQVTTARISGSSHKSWMTYAGEVKSGTPEAQTPRGARSVSAQTANPHFG